ncbi:purple acid phosphatase family protein [Pedobacter boryungensis]|uniref:Metallophosphoesterase family protein n=1 Tax=Pedobacter boryungensis TaxID=869962 RepID=A0ABX2DAL6_9SPHI|nr:metallophosphoesterase family protein [Pedobacter boryungensis]NQX31100.1 metallophosphoesterase family protein [Pedobacter boryungensis]
MKKLTLLFVGLIASLGLNPVLAQTTAFTVIANPGANASSEIRLNWHTSLGSGDSYITFTKKSDKNWKKATILKADQALCTVFDSIYSKKANGDSFYEDARFLRNTIALQGLTPNTIYQYKLSSATSPAKETDEIHEFNTAPKSGKWQMGVISDMHVYAPLPDRQKAAMKMIQQLETQNKKPLNMMLHVGDIAAWGGSYSFWPALYADSTFRKYVWAGVNGNHDNMTRQNAQSNQFFRNVNSYPLNGYAGEIGVSYHFTYGGALFIMLNNEAMRSEEGLTKAQNWTKEVIKNNPATYIIVMEHYQWFNGEDGKSAQYNRWKELFDEYGVDLAISGNNHIYVRTNAVYAEKETDGTKGTVYIQTPSSDNERGVSSGEQRYNNDLIKFRWTEGSKTVGAILMKADKKQLSLTLFDRKGQAIDQVAVKAKRK